MLSRKWASTVSTNLVLAVSLTKDTAVFKSYSFLRSLNFWISKNLLDLVWGDSKRTISLEIEGQNIKYEQFDDQDTQLNFGRSMQMAIL